jgi:threonine/homoserine/homoserine lactone efflux protein
VTLEARYRRLSRLFPSEWRARHEEELIGTLLEGAEPGRRSVPLAEAADLVRGAIVLRSRALAAKAGLRAPPRLAGLAGLATVLALAVALLARPRVSDLSAEFLLASLVVVVLPGTGVVYTLSSAIGGGRRRGLFAAVGCTLGIVPHLLAAMLGLSGIMQAGAVAFETVRWVGVAYLVFMGLLMLRGGDAMQLDRERRASSDPMGAVVWRAVLLNLLNPKLTVFFFAFLPQFLDSPPSLLDPRLVELGGVFMLMTLAVFVGYALAASAVRERVLAAPAMLRWIQRSLGALLVGFAARLAFSDR